MAWELGYYPTREAFEASIVPASSFNLEDLSEMEEG
jgi:hypothetical protein